MPSIQAVLQRVGEFVEKIHQQHWRGHNGKPIRHVVNIGIGGFRPGPMLVTRALKPYSVGKSRIALCFESRWATSRRYIRSLGCSRNLIYCGFQVFQHSRNLTKRTSRPENGSWPKAAVLRPYNNISLLFPAISLRQPHLALLPRTVFLFGIGWEGVIPCGRRLGCR